jgi:hypothetical protein
MVTVESAMTNIASEDNFEPTANRASGEAADVADRGQSRGQQGQELGQPQPAVEREPRHSRQGKLREPLYASIVHFDAEPSSRPPPLGEEA